MEGNEATKRMNDPTATIKRSVRYEYIIIFVCTNAAFLDRSTIRPIHLLGPHNTIKYFCGCGAQECRLPTTSATTTMTTRTSFVRRIEHRPQGPQFLLLVVLVLVLVLIVPTIVSPPTHIILHLLLPSKAYHFRRHRRRLKNHSHHK